jgi:DNA-directed RNA polymerase subunit RPC12/RpoP
MKGFTFPNEKELAELRKAYREGLRVELVQMNDPYSKLRAGDKGTVKKVDDAGNIRVRWDNGEGLSVIYGVDIIRIVEETDLVCNRCGCRVFPSDNPEYKYQCYNCDEDLDGWEVRIRHKDEPPKRIRVGYMANGELEYLTDRNDEPLEFDNRAEAELHLISLEYPASDIQYLRFVEVA